MRNGMEGRSEIRNAIESIHGTIRSMNAHLDTITTNQTTGGRNYEGNIEKIRELDKQLQVIERELFAIRHKDQV